MDEKAASIIEILNAQLPVYFRPILEFQGIMKAHGSALGTVEEVYTQLRNNFYLATCDEPTIAYYEKLFKIAVHAGDSLDFRRGRILQKFITIVPFSVDFLRNQLTELYGEDGYTLDIDAVALILKIKVTSDRYRAIDLLYDLLLDVVPAHIQILANQQTTNNVSGRLYASGNISGTFIQTIYNENRLDIPCGVNTAAGIISGTMIKSIKSI